MSKPAGPETLSALAWLVEAGAEEAIGEEPVNRFAAKAVFSNPPLEGGSKAGSRDSAKTASGRGVGELPHPSQKFASQISTLPQGEGQKRSIDPADSIGTAMELAAGAKTLAELKAALEGFDGGALKRGATNTVFADGNPQSRIMFIGEAPGRDEDRQGLPFVGRAGKLLDKMLAAISLDRTSAYITNVLNWRPPDNREPTPEEAAMCLPFLRRHIELVNPQVIILLGGVSLRHVMGNTSGIMKTRGRWLDYNVAGRMVPVMPTLHPAYLLRQPAHKKLAWRDLQAVAARMEAL
jgi:DNA polymerase